MMPRNEYEVEDENLDSEYEEGYEPIEESKDENYEDEYEEGYELEEEEENSSQEKSEEKSDISKSDNEEVYEIPDYIPDELLPPESFKDEKEELNFYRKSYIDLVEYMRSEKFRDMIVEKYSQILLEKHEEGEKLIAIKEMLDKNPKGVIKIYAPELLVKEGRNPFIEKAEADSMIHEALVNSFGEEYLEIYDSNEANKKGTASYEMLKIMNKIQLDVDKHNEYVKSLIEERENKEKASKEQIIESQYKYFEDIFDKSEYYKVVDTITEYYKNASLMDLYKGYIFDYAIERAYERGLNDGSNKQKEKIVGDFKKAGSTVKYTKPQRKKQEDILDKLNPGGRFIINPFMR